MEETLIALVKRLSSAAEFSFCEVLCSGCTHIDCNRHDEPCKSCMVIVKRSHFRTKPKFLDEEFKREITP